MDPVLLQQIIENALKEDIGSGDVTTNAIISPEMQGVFHMVAREPLIACGLPLVERIFETLDGTIKVILHVKEGAQVKAGSKMVSIEGPARTILTGERVALNFVQHLSAIATYAHRFVEEVKGTDAIILDTRKTIPGLRMLEKYAVKTGGAQNHRMRLDDGVLIKDNHISAAGSITAAIRLAKEKIVPSMPVEVECDTFTQVQEAFEAGADRLLLDNMDIATLKQVVKLNEKYRLPLEASGGVTLKTVREIAQTGVKFISVGRLTHSAPQVDIGLDSDPQA